MATTYVFDAYGTLFDVHSAVHRQRGALGPQADRLSELWRVKQLEYTWVRSLMDAYEDFAQCTAKALDWAARATGVQLSDDLRARLMAAYFTLDTFPEVKAALTVLKARNARTAILSNGAPAMLQSAVASAGIAELLDDVISVDTLKVFKVDPRVYESVTRRYAIQPSDVSYQSSNRWDIAAAKKFGFRTIWINRSGVPDEYADLPADHVARSLDAVAA